MSDFANTPWKCGVNQYKVLSWIDDDSEDDSEEDVEEASYEFSILPFDLSDTWFIVSEIEIRDEVLYEEKIADDPDEVLFIKMKE